jgi:hypothetical protein
VGAAPTINMLVSSIAWMKMMIYFRKAARDSPISADWTAGQPQTYSFGPPYAARDHQSTNDARASGWLGRESWNIYESDFGGVTSLQGSESTKSNRSLVFGHVS